LEAIFLTEGDTRAVEKRLIGAGPEGVAARDEQARNDETGNAAAEPACKHPESL
jgi:hypothetical protein